MATGSPSVTLVSTLNATTSQYRSITIHLEKVLPLLVRNEKAVVRVRWGQKPHRRYNNLGGEFSLAIDPPQVNDLATAINAVESARFAKTGDVPPVLAPVFSYMYLTREQ